MRYSSVGNHSKTKYREKKKRTNEKNLIQVELGITPLVWFGLVWFGFYGLSTIVAYLMGNPLYKYILNIYDLVGLGFMAYQPLWVI